MTPEILLTEQHKKGLIFNIKTDDKTIIRILFLHHSLKRIKQWGIKTNKVTETLIYPEEVLTGHKNSYIAHRRYGNHIIRAIYDYEDRLPVVVTVYFPYAERYFKGGTDHEDRILKRR